MEENKNEVIQMYAKKGFLLDKDSLEFFIKLNNLKLSEDILNHVSLIVKSRMITRKILHEHYHDLKIVLSSIIVERPAIDEFFKEVANINLTPINPLTGHIKNEDPNPNNFKIISSNIIPYRRIEVKDFVLHFKNRYNFFKNMLQERKELPNLVSINKIGENRNFSIIGLVSNKRVTKNKNIILEIEDLTGRTNVLISGDKEEITKKAKEVVCDDVIGIKCSGSGNFTYANEIIFPDCFALEKRKVSEEGYALFISDIHIGSSLFLEEKFKKFMNWMRGDDVDEATKHKIDKIKYLFIVGDNVDGVGVYPGQEALLNIKDLKEQYKKLAEYLKMIPSHVKIIMCPGQHDAVRVPEPQPAIGEDFAKELTEMKNVFLVSNPSTVEIECEQKKNGFKVLMYHGASMIRNWIDEIEELRLSQAHHNPSKIVKYMLRHRHLSPTHSSNVYVPSEKEDSMVIKDVPDIIVTGDLHKSDVDMYNNVLIICCSCWQSMTPFEEKVGNLPDPCKVPMLNLKTRELKILYFS